MSKKHPHGSVPVSSQATGSPHEAEYKIIKSDLVKVVALNVVYLIGILILYYYNQKSLFLDNWFAKILNF